MKELREEIEFEIVTSKVIAEPYELKPETIKNFIEEDGLKMVWYGGRVEKISGSEQV